MRYFRPKSRHSDKRIYRKLIVRRLKKLLNEESGSLCCPTASSAALWIKIKHKYKILKNLLSKNRFPQSPKRTKKYSSKYNGYRSFINIAQNLGHVQNKNFNFSARQI